MRTAVRAQSAAATRTPPSRPYPPSWLDSLIEGIDRLPGPAAVYYLVLWLGTLLAETMLKWWDGAYPPGTIFPFHVWFSAVGPYILFTSRHLDAVASEALHDCRPALTVTEAEYAQLHYELTTTPRRPVRVARDSFVQMWRL
ncbi:MAG TPA: hypothetical protein PKE45_04600, partial [Caldilineaceae bacterium]|nr:hypothetical protein [Caldilineaceae bacterium]